MCAPSVEKHGATPANIQWTVVRGDDATLKVEFFEDDETTYFDTSDWTFTATAYDVNEDDATLVVLEGSHKYHEIFLDEKNGINTNKLILDGNINIYENENIVQEWLEQINSFIIN